MDFKLDLVQVTIPEDANVIIGQSHFIKTVEDIYECIVTTNPSLKFGIAFIEASGPRLIRFDGNDEELIKIAVENAQKIGAGHCFVIVLKEGFPINIKNQLQNVQEVIGIFAAESEQGRGILGVIDGFKPLGIENQKDIENREDFLRKITQYKR